MKIDNTSTNVWAITVDGVSVSMVPAAKIELDNLTVTINGVTYQDNLETNWHLYLGEGQIIAKPVWTEQAEFVSGMNWALPLVGLLAAFWAVKKGLNLGAGDVQGS